MAMARPWRPLEPGEPLGVVALSGPVDPDRLQTGLDVLESWGHPLILAPNLETADGYFAGDDDVRVEALDWVVQRGAQTIVAARGGYGVTRLLSKIHLENLAAERIRFVGFSDLTALMNPLVAAGGAVQIHGPMVAAGMQRSRNAERLRAVLEGKVVGERLFRIPARAVSRPGRAVGTAIGGNLAVLTALVGTGYEPCYEGSVLFIEEVDEPVYRLDRMLTHLAASGRLRQVKALICGSLRGCGSVAERAPRWRELINEATPRDAVLVDDMPFGHGASNLAFPLGAQVAVDTEAGEIRWSS